MKKLSLVFAVVGFMFIAFTAKAQTTPDYFVGKWDVLVKGTPNGDVHFLFTLMQKDGKLVGTFVDPESKKDMPLTSAEEKDGKATLYFTVSSYDVNLTLEKVDDNNVKGSLMGMFDSTGVRVKS